MLHTTTCVLGLKKGGSAPGREFDKGKACMEYNGISRSESSVEAMCTTSRTSRRRVRSYLDMI